ncbi:MAG: hypothetical protein ACRD3T_02665 [Terriglobia bacterium]
MTRGWMMKADFYALNIYGCEPSIFTNSRGAERRKLGFDESLASFRYNSFPKLPVRHPERSGVLRPGAKKKSSGCELTLGQIQSTTG